MWEVVVLLKLAVFKLEKCWKSEHELRFYLNQSSGLPKLSCFHKTLKSIFVCKSWNYCTSASSNYDSHLVIIISKFLSSLVNNLGFYKMSEIKNIYSRRCTFSTLTVDSCLPTFKALLPQITRACCLQSLIFLKLELLLHSATKVTGVSACLSHIELKVIWCFLDNKLSVIRFDLFCDFLLVFCWRGNMINTRNSFLRSFHIYRRWNRRWNCKVPYEAIVVYWKICI